MTVALLAILVLLLVLGWCGVQLGLHEWPGVPFAYGLLVAGVVLLIFIRMFPTTVPILGLR